MQQILVKIMDAADPDWVEDANNRVRIPWLEERAVDDPYRERPAPRIFGSHLPPDMLPHGVKDKQIKVMNCNIQALLQTSTWGWIHAKWSACLLSCENNAEINCNHAKDHMHLLYATFPFRLCMCGGTPKTSWCPSTTLLTVGSCWNNLRALTSSFSSSWMVMVGSVLRGLWTVQDLLILFVLICMYASYSTCWGDALVDHFNFGLIKPSHSPSAALTHTFVFNSLHGIVVWSGGRILRSTRPTEHPFCAVWEHAEGQQSLFCCMFNRTW